MTGSFNLGVETKIALVWNKEAASKNARGQLPLSAGQKKLVHKVLIIVSGLRSQNQTTRFLTTNAHK